ncbi:adenine nucleotide alpha hydrolase family protein [Niameybacter massiliensis]|uniref:hypothetical protein n=1 Tax=Niameybacter massiliensis TaxID=1658108 RepID=UPI0006B4AD85|nr:hypothetical protein [Niameybacter massiliensis]
MNKVLVCITIQENSKRLIRKGYDLATEKNGELHIIHIRKGETIFESPDSSLLFEELFVYGSELGGQVHFLCSTDIPKTIHEFIIKNNITQLIIGKPPVSSHAPSLSTVYEQLIQLPETVEVCVLDREEN